MSNLFLVLFSIFAGQICSQRNGFIFIEKFSECEGKDSANYTRVVTQLTDDDCSQNSIVVTSNNLIQTQPNGNKAVSSLAQLALSRWPAGAYIQMEGLFLATDGPIQGKFVYLKKIYLIRDYIKKCSSVLGSSYVSAKSIQLLISDNLDPNILVSPNGAYELFKKGCTTICKGQLVNV